MKRILFIRGGAIGDFILTLPAVKLVQDKWPDAELEVLGYPAITELGLHSGYFAGARSMDQGGLVGFFVPNNILDPDWMDYFGSFDLIVSYLFDPDALFRTNLEKCGPGQIITVSPKVVEGRPAAFHLAKPLDELELTLDSPQVTLSPSPEKQATAKAWLEEQGLSENEDADLLVAHPGSGSAAKNWTNNSWQALLTHWLETQHNRRAILVGGEAEGGRLHTLRQALPKELHSRIKVAENLPLPVLAALLQQADRFLGHDSGISHLAAAVGTPSLALFGPTDPATWAPQGKRVALIANDRGAMSEITVEEVLQKLGEL